MVLRTPILLVAVVAAALITVAMPGDGSGLLMLTPALALILPLLFSAYPGERSLAKLTSLLSRLSLPDVSRPPITSLFTGPARPALAWFPEANGSRGPPFLSA